MKLKALLRSLLLALLVIVTGCSVFHPDNYGGVHSNSSPEPMHEVKQHEVKLLRTEPPARARTRQALSIPAPPDESQR